MNKYILFFILTALTGIAQAQAPDQMLFVKDHISLTLTNTWSRTKETTTFGGGASLGLRPDVGGKLGLIYTINLGRRFGMETGTYLGVQSIGYRVQVDTFPNYPLNNFPIRDAHAYVEIPFRVFGRFRLTDKVYSYSYLGAHFTRLRDFRGGMSTSDSLGRPGLSFGYETNVFYGMYLYWDLGTGFLIRLGNEDMVRLNLLWHPNADRSYLMEGEYSYRVYDTGQIFKVGRWNWRGSYIGLEVGYVFTRSRELKRDLDKLR